jgi:hypothetical protein
MSYIIHKNILTPNIIQHLKNLLKDLDFFIGKDMDETAEKIFNKDFKFQGMLRITTDQNNVTDKNLYNRLNDIAFIVTEIVCKKSNINLKRIQRFMWNFYKQGEEGTFHKDNPDENFYTIVYSLNTSDGYLEINNQKIYDIEDEAKIFKSNIFHKGVGPTKDNFRLNLNIILEANNEAKS